MKKIYSTLAALFAVNTFVSAQCTTTPLPYFEGFESPPIILPNLPGCTAQQSVIPPHL